MRTLTVHPDKRISIEEIQKHPWLTKKFSPPTTPPPPSLPCTYSITEQDVSPFSEALTPPVETAFFT